MLSVGNLIVFPALVPYENHAGRDVILLFHALMQAFLFQGNSHRSRLFSILVYWLFCCLVMVIVKWELVVSLVKSE